MLEKCYNSLDKRNLVKQATVVFEELSSGVYHITKGEDLFHKSFTNANTVISELNSDTYKVAVTGKTSVYSNFKLE